MKDSVPSGLSQFKLTTKFRPLRVSRRWWCCRHRCSEEIKKRKDVRFPPLGGCREGFHRLAHSFEIADKPLPATTHSNHTPPKGGN